MRRIVVALLGTVSGLVMLFSYHTSTQGGSGGTAGLGGGTSGGGSLGGSGSASGGNAAQQNGSGSSGSTEAKIVKGDTVDTRWGPVQVAIKVGGGKILAVDAIEYPTENRRDQEINSYAIPALNQEVMDAQSADIDMISGATVTSRGYIESLQSALDKAGM